MDRLDPDFLTIPLVAWQAGGLEDGPLNACRRPQSSEARRESPSRSTSFKGDPFSTASRVALSPS